MAEPHLGLSRTLSGLRQTLHVKGSNFGENTVKGSIFFGAGGTRRRRVRIFARGFRFSREGFEYLREGDEGFEFFRGIRALTRTTNQKKSRAKKRRFYVYFYVKKFNFSSPAPRSTFAGFFDVKGSDRFRPSQRGFGQVFSIPLAHLWQRVRKNVRFLEPSWRIFAQGSTFCVFLQPSRAFLEKGSNFCTFSRTFWCILAKGSKFCVFSRTFWRISAKGSIPGPKAFDPAVEMP